MFKRPEEWYIKTIKRVLDEEAPGYEFSIWLAVGMARAWLASREINRKFYNELRANIEVLDEYLDDIEQKYGRLLNICR
jgi:hypothetical protein